MSGRRRDIVVIAGKVMCRSRDLWPLIFCVLNVSVACFRQVYEGEWRQGHHHGQGSMQYGAGNQYSGQWTLGKKNGFGKMTYPDGARCVCTMREHNACDKYILAVHTYVDECHTWCANLLCRTFVTMFSTAWPPSWMTKVEACVCTHLHGAQRLRRSEFVAG